MFFTIKKLTRACPCSKTLPISACPFLRSSKKSCPNCITAQKRKPGMPSRIKPKMSNGGTQMKRLLSLFLALCLVLGLVLLPPLSASAEKAYAVPDCFNVTYTVSERKTNNGQSFVSKEYVSTCQPSVDREINGLWTLSTRSFLLGCKERPALNGTAGWISMW